MELSQRVVKMEKMSHTKEEFIAVSRIEGFNGCGSSGFLAQWKTRMR